MTKQAIIDSVLSWTVCVFSTYDGSSHWKSVCGKAPPVRPSYTFNVFILTFISGQGVIITTIFEWNNFLSLTKKIISRFASSIFFIFLTSFKFLITLIFRSQISTRCPFTLPLPLSLSFIFLFFSFSLLSFCILLAIQYNIIQYNTIQYNTIQYNTIQYNTIQYSTIQYNTIQYNTIQ